MEPHVLPAASQLPLAADGINPESELATEPFALVFKAFKTKARIRNPGPLPKLGFDRAFMAREMARVQSVHGGHSFPNN